MIARLWKLLKDLVLGKKFELHEPDHYTRSEKIELGKQWVEMLGYKKCVCWTKHGPDRTCPICSGFGAKP